MTTVSIEVATGRVIFDRSASSMAPEAVPTVHEGNDGWLPGERIKLHLFIDASIIELFIDDVLALTGRIYPTRTDSLGVATFAVGGNAEIEAIDIWQLDLPAALHLRGSDG